MCVEIDRLEWDQVIDGDGLAVARAWVRMRYVGKSNVEKIEIHIVSFNAAFQARRFLEKREDE